MFTRHTGSFLRSNIYFHYFFFAIYESFLILLGTLWYWASRYPSKFAVRLARLCEQQVQNLDMLLYVLFWNPRKLTVTEVPRVR